MATEPTSRTSYREGVGLVLLTVAPFVLLMGLAWASEGRDLTRPFLGGSALFAGTGAGLVVLGLWRRWDRRATAGAATVLSALVCFWIPQEVSWVGADETAILTVVVRDAQTHLPVPGASVRLVQEADPEASPTAGQTGAAGAAHLDHRFWAIGRSSLVRRQGRYYFWQETLWVEAEGYRPLRERLETFTGRGWPMYGPPLPVVEVSLKK